MKDDGTLAEQLDGTTVEVDTDGYPLHLPRWWWLRRAGAAGGVRDVGPDPSDGEAVAGPPRRLRSSQMNPTLVRPEGKGGNDATGSRQA